MPLTVVHMVCYSGGIELTIGHPTEYRSSVKGPDNRGIMEKSGTYSLANEILYILTSHH